MSTGRPMLLKGGVPRQKRQIFSYVLVLHYIYNVTPLKIRQLQTPQLRAGSRPKIPIYRTFRHFSALCPFLKIIKMSTQKER